MFFMFEKETVLVGLELESSGESHRGFYIFKADFTKSVYNPLKDLLELYYYLLLSVGTKQERLVLY